MPHVILASASTGRLCVLRGAGLDPQVHVAAVDEEGLLADHAAHLDGLPDLPRAEAATCLLATAKARAAAAALAPLAPGTLVIGCDSLLLHDGVLQGKPHTPERARARWLAQRGQTAHLVSGHALIWAGEDGLAERSAAAATRIHFADLSEAEIDAYVATGEPLGVAGAFTLDGLGGPFVDAIEGDYHAVIGLSLPLVRRLAADLGIFWPCLWAPQAR